MTAAATTSRSSHTPRTPWTPHSQSRSSTTPMGPPSRVPPPSVGQAEPPALSPHSYPTSPPRQSTNLRAPSPGYFGLTVQEEENDNPTNSDAGGYARKNWKTPASSIKSKGSDVTPGMPHEANPSLAAFRKQSETKVFQLDTGSSISSASSPRPSILSHNSYRSTASSRKSPKTITKDSQRESSDEAEGTEKVLKSPLKRGLSSDAFEESKFGLPRRESPANLPTLNSGAVPRQLSNIDDRHPRLSLPHHRVDDRSPPNDSNSLGRSRTLPSELTGGQPGLISAQDFANLIRNVEIDNFLLLDLRVSPQYALSRVRGALNLCIPTTLLKRPSFNVQKLLETFTVEAEKEKFSQWKDMHYIIMYDANSSQLKDANSAVNTVKKFTTEGWKGVAYIVRGGFAEISKKLPDMIQKVTGSATDYHHSNHLALNARAPGGTQVAGGLSMPAQQSAANPFFGNIRQNMDLIGGVGQMPIKQPDLLTIKGFKLLPTWLQQAAEEVDRGKAVSDHFLSIEKDEQERMRDALSTNVVYGTPGPMVKSGFQVAGIEKGTKNRYKDILPFDHARVKIQDPPSASCDYINASHIKAEWSNKHYIATQAPMPATFEDFWRVVWEQDVRVIVMLSAEVEGGQRKCHPYWIPDTYGPMKVKAISEKRIILGSSSNNLATPASFKSPLLTPQPERATPRRQRAVTQINPFGAQETPKDIPDETPFVIRRTMTLSHTSQPFQPMREITQLHYPHWPDFGAPAHATDLLALVEQTNLIVRKYSTDNTTDPDLPAGPGERPIVVHCSAGCGRTGTFCTIDSVIDMLKRQREVQKTQKPIIEGEDEMDIDEETWLRSDEYDLIAKAVEDFRRQRLSMVQTLRQYVLCYETILEWLVKEMPEKFRRETLRRSFGG